MINLTKFLFELESRYKLESPEGIFMDIAKLVAIVKVQNETLQYYSYSSETRCRNALVAIAEVEKISCE